MNERVVGRGNSVVFSKSINGNTQPKLVLNESLASEASGDNNKNDAI
jgi:hypothetical protein